MENRFQRENEFYSEENSVNLSQFNREEPASQNLDMCDDDLFNDLFPSNKDQGKFRWKYSGVDFFSWVDLFYQIRQIFFVLLFNF